MKKILLISALLSLASVALPQGSVNFDNRTADNNAAIFNVDPANPSVRKVGNTATGVPAGSVTYAGAPLSGTGFTATLWGANAASATGSADANNLSLLATTTFRPQTSGGFSGRVSPLAANPTVPGVASTSDRATFQVRVWNNQGGTITTWTDALLAASQNRTTIGYSDLFTIPQPLGDLVPPGGTPTTAPNLIGLTSFQLFAVPEPSVIALGVLGAGCLFLLRRRK